MRRISNERLVRLYLWDDVPVSMVQIEGILEQSVGESAKKGLGFFGLRSRGEAKHLVLCGFRSLGNPAEIELAYELSQEPWGRGFATEVARICLRYAFEEVGLERVVTGVEPQNVASIKVIEKLGVRYAGEIVPGQLGTQYCAEPKELPRPQRKRLSRPLEAVGVGIWENLRAPVTRAGGSDDVASRRTQRTGNRHTARFDWG